MVVYHHRDRTNGSLGSQKTQQLQKGVWEGVSEEVGYNSTRVVMICAPESRSLLLHKSIQWLVSWIAKHTQVDSTLGKGKKGIMISWLGF